MPFEKKRRNEENGRNECLWSWSVIPRLLLSAFLRCTWNVACRFHGKPQHSKEEMPCEIWAPIVFFTPSSSPLLLCAYDAELFKSLHRHRCLFSFLSFFFCSYGRGGNKGGLGADALGTGGAWGERWFRLHCATLKLYCLSCLGTKRQAWLEAWVLKTMQKSKCLAL